MLASAMYWPQPRRVHLIHDGEWRILSVLLLDVQLDSVSIMSREAAPRALRCVCHVGVREETAGGETSW
jgi:hypothetical protein